MGREEKHNHRRQRRADGELSRNRILDAAAEIAVERGYEGTSIGSVSAKCGLPASSIYWHFKNKDDLITAVMERSFTDWFASWEIPVTEFTREGFGVVAEQRARKWQESPDFMRLGLMLALERRPVEPRARALFLQIRNQAIATIVDNFRRLVPSLSDRQTKLLAIYSVACTEGLFITNEIGGQEVDPVELFAMSGRSLYDTAMHMSAEGDGKSG